MKHFTIEELTHSDTAIGHGIANNPGAVERENLRRLAERVLDPARERLGAPIYVNSGYRNCAVNRLVGGARRRPRHPQRPQRRTDAHPPVASPHRTAVGTGRPLDTRSPVTAADGAFSAVKTAENGGLHAVFLTEIGCRGLKNVKNKAKPLNIKGLAFIVEFLL